MAIRIERPFFNMTVRIKHAYMSSTVQFFKDRMLNKFGLENVRGPGQPCVIFGLYKDRDYDFLAKHRAPVIVVFRGSDALKVATFKTASILNRIPIRIYAPGKFVYNTLKKAGVNSTILPITSCPTDIMPVPRGDAIYHYRTTVYSATYGDQYIEGIRKKTGLKIIQANKNTYSREELINVYKQCFMGLRLTMHDGLPNTVLELGMMGRRSLYNGGGIPCSIKWPVKNIDAMCDLILQEYKRRKINDEKEISDAVKNYINIGTKWLEI